eukprot:3630176-Amphidinium_carterae.2
MKQVCHTAGNKKKLAIKPTKKREERVPSDCLTTRKTVYDEAWAGQRDGRSAGLSADAIHPKREKVWEARSRAAHRRITWLSWQRRTDPRIKAPRPAWKSSKREVRKNEMCAHECSAGDT